MNIDVQVIFSYEMACEGNYFIPIIIDSHYYVSYFKNQTTQFFLRTIINVNINMQCRDSNDYAPYSLRKKSHIVSVLNTKI